MKIQILDLDQWLILYAYSPFLSHTSHTRHAWSPFILDENEKALQMPLSYFPCLFVALVFFTSSLQSFISIHSPTLALCYIFFGKWMGFQWAWITLNCSLFHSLQIFIPPSIIKLNRLNTKVTICTYFINK